MELRTGQIVNWPPAPLGWAQVIELRRTCVRLLYITRRGTQKFPLVDFASLPDAHWWQPGLGTQRENGLAVLTAAVRTGLTRAYARMDEMKRAGTW